MLYCGEHLFFLFMRITNTGVETIFSCESLNVNLPMELRACFTSKNFYKYEGETILTLQVGTHLKGFVENYCPFTNEEIERHLKYLNVFTDESQALQLLYIKDINCYPVESGKEIKLKIIGSNKWHRLVMIWSRYLYESPFQWAMKDAWRLSDETGIDPFLAVQIIMNSFSIGNTNHTLYGRLRFYPISIEDFKKCFDELPSTVDHNTDWPRACGTNPSLQSIWYDKDRQKSEDEQTLDINVYQSGTWDKTWDIRKNLYERTKKLLLH